jgi:hypothetical protein
MKKPPGATPGVRLSTLKWRASDGSLARTHKGTFNRAIVSAFLVPISPSEAIPALLKWVLKSDMAFNGKPRNYVQGRVYELRRRGLLEIVK